MDGGWPVPDGHFDGVVRRKSCDFPCAGMGRAGSPCPPESVMPKDGAEASRRQVSPGSRPDCIRTSNDMQRHVPASGGEGTRRPTRLCTDETTSSLPDNSDGSDCRCGSMGRPVAAGPSEKSESSSNAGQIRTIPWGRGLRRQTRRKRRHGDTERFWMGSLLEEPSHVKNVSQPLDRDVFLSAKLLPAKSPCLLSPRAPCLAPQAEGKGERTSLLDVRPKLI